MCPLTTSMIAGTLATFSASMAASAGTVAAITVAGNTLIGAGLSAGIGAATGARGRDLWTAAAIGGATAGVASGAGAALGGVSTIGTTTDAAGKVVSATDSAGKFVYTTTPGMLSPATSTVGASGLTAEEVEGLSQSQIQAAKQLASNAEPASQAAAASIKEADIANYGMMAANVAQGTVEGISGYEEAKDTAKSLKEQARLNEIRAGQAQEAAALEKMDQARKTRQLVGQQKTAAAANGVMLESRAESSPAMFEQDTMAELAWDNAKTDYNANLEAWGYMQNAAQLRRQARAVRRTGNLKLASGLIKGGVSAAGTYFSGQSRAATNRLYA